MDERLIHPTLDAIRRPHVPEPQRFGRFHEREFIARLQIVLDRGLRAVVGAEVRVVVDDECCRLCGDRSAEQYSADDERTK